MNPILFLNYPSHFYKLFLSCTFTSATLYYSLLFFRPSTFRSATPYTRLDWREGIRSTSGPRVFTRNEGFFSQMLKDWKIVLGVVGDDFFSILLKSWIGSVLDTIEDALIESHPTKYKAKNKWNLR